MACSPPSRYVAIANFSRGCSLTMAITDGGRLCQGYQPVCPGRFLWWMGIKVLTGLLKLLRILDDSRPQRYHTNEKTHPQFCQLVFCRGCISTRS